MSKAIKAAVKVFVVTVAVLSGVGLFLPALAGVSGSAFFTTILFKGGMSIIGYATMAAVGTLVNGLLSKGIEASAQNFGTKVAGRSAQDPRQIVYGECRVGGTITHIETSGTDNSILSMIVVLAGHEIESLEEVMINDQVLSTSSNGGFLHAINSQFTNSDNDNRFSHQNSLVRFRFVDGSQTAADNLIAGQTNLGTADKFISCAYVLVQCVYDSEKFGSFPRMSFLIKGKKCFDPRNNQTAFTSNPALHIRDYLTDTVYGLKCTADEIDDTTALGGIASAANTCDTDVSPTTATNSGAVNNSNQVTLNTAGTLALVEKGDVVTGSGISGTVKVVRRRRQVLTLDTNITIANNTTLTFSQPTYTSNGFTNMAATGQGVLEALASSMAGKVSYVNGKFKVFAGASVTPELTITDDDIITPITVNTNATGGDSYNAAKAIFVDGNNNFIATDTPVYTDSTLLAADTPTGESSANYRKTLEIQTPFTTSQTMAQRIAKTQLLHSRQNLTLTAIVTMRFIELQPFDHVYLTNERLGFSQKRFEVLAVELTLLQDNDNVNSMAVKLDLKEIDPAVYTFLNSQYEDPIDEGDPDDNDGGDGSISAPTGLALAQQTQQEGAGFKIDIKASWTNIANDIITGTEVQYKLSTDADYTSDFVVGKGVSVGLIPNVVIGKTYNVRVAHIASTGVKSAYSSVVNLTISDPSSISAPASFTVTSAPVAVFLQWTNPNNHNLRAVKVYRHTSSFTPTDDTYLVNTLLGEPNSVMYDVQGAFQGLSAGVTYHFALRAVTNTGVHSAFTTLKTGSFSLDKGTVNLNNLGDLDSSQNTKLTNIEDNATVGAKLGTNFKDSGNNSLGDEDVRNSDLSVDFTNDTTFRIKKGSNVIDTQTFAKGNVGLTDLASLDSTQDSKLTGIEANATVGAKAGVNLKRNNNAVIGDADIITSEGTSDDTENVNSVAKADVTGSITGVQTNVAGLVQGLGAGTQSINAGSLNAGSILTSLLKLDEILLQTSGTGTSGQSAVFGSSPTAVSLGSIGTGAGLYMGTVSIELIFGSTIRGGSIHLELRNSSGTVQYERYFNPQIDDANNVYAHNNNYATSDREIHLEFGHFFLGSGALNAFIVADSNGSSSTTIVKIRAVRFGAEVVSFNTASFTASKTGQTAGADVDSGTVTVSGFTGSKTGTLTGHSSALVSINGGTFNNASNVAAITANQTFELRLTASSTAGTTRTCTFDIDGTSVTYSVTTAGTYTPTFSGGGGGGSAGGGFESNTQLQ